MALAHAEAQRLLQLQKSFQPSVSRIDFPLTLPFDHEFELCGAGSAPERFLLDLERGMRKRARLKYQTRAHKVYILARLDLHGPPHRNPPNAPHRAGERFTGHHLHIYHEGFSDRVAYQPNEVPGFVQPSNGDDVSWLVAFLDFCHVKPVPPIQLSL